LLKPKFLIEKSFVFDCQISEIIQLQYILLTFGFPFGPFKSYHKILVSFLMVSNFGLGDGKI